MKKEEVTFFSHHKQLQTPSSKLTAKTIKVFAELKKKFFYGLPRLS
jgi:hypothetical protein